MTFLRSLLLDTRDGEWGKGEAAAGLIKMRVVRGTDFSNVREGIAKDVPWRFLEQKHADRKRLKCFDIILETAGGSPDRPTGRSILLTPRVLDVLGQDVTCASFARFLRVDPTKADPAFVFWLLQHLYASRAIAQFNTQHTGVARFQFTTFCDTYKLDLPSLREQCRIAAILGAYDELIEVNRRRISLLEDMARDLYEEWFDRFRFPGHESVGSIDTPIGPVPSGWKHVRLDDLLVLQRGFDLPASTRSPGIFNVISASGRHGTHAEAKVKGPGIVTGRSGTIGKVHLVFEDHWPLNTTLYVKEYKHCGPAFAYQLLIHLDLASKSSGSAVPTLNRNHVHGLSITVPCDDTLDRFEHLAMGWLTLANNLTKQSEHLATARDLLLPRLISGQLSVAAAERELLEAA